MDAKKIRKIKFRKFLLCTFLTITGAVLFALSNPNPLVKQGVFFTAWFMYIPYLFLIKKSFVKNCWFYSGIYGVLCVCSYAYWLYNYNPVCLGIGLAVGFIGMALFGLAQKLIQKYFSQHAWLIQFLAVCTFEYLRTLGFLGFHYGLAAYTQWNMPLILQGARITGVFGLNCYIIFCSAVIFAIVSKIQNEELSSLRQRPFPFKSRIVFIYDLYVFKLRYESLSEIFEKQSSEFCLLLHLLRG